MFGMGYNAKVGYSDSPCQPSLKELGKHLEMEWDRYHRLEDAVGVLAETDEFYPVQNELEKSVLLWFGVLRVMRSNLSRRSNELNDQLQKEGVVFPGAHENDQEEEDGLCISVKIKKSDYDELISRGMISSMPPVQEC